MTKHSNDLNTLAAWPPGSVACMWSGLPFGSVVYMSPHSVILVSGALSILRRKRVALPPAWVRRDTQAWPDLLFPEQHELLQGGSSKRKASQSCSCSGCMGVASRGSRASLILPPAFVKLKGC